jgi:hypothetical protein
MIFFDENGVYSRTEVVDQFKDNDSESKIISTNITYNEPLTKKISLVLNYGINLNNSTSTRKTLDASSIGRYDLLNLNFSNDFEATQIAHQSGAILNYKSTKTNLNFGTRMNAVNLDQYEAISGNSYKRSYLNWIPQLNYQYKFSAQRSIRVSYYGYTNQPTVEQLQPVKVNTDPLNVPLGNPNLKAAYTSNFNFYYNSYKMISNQSLYVYGSIDFTNNQIVSNTETDSKGKSIRQSVNLKEKTPINYNVNGGFSRKIKALANLELGLGLSASGGSGYNYVKEEGKDIALNETSTSRFSPRFRANRYAEKFEVSLSFGPSYNAQESSLQIERSNKGWGTSGYGSFKVNLPKKFIIEAEAQYTYTPSSASFNNSFEQMIINASVSKSFFKKEDLKASIKVNDLLNQNSGFSRSASDNLITQTSYSNISRYFMFSLVWDFNKMGGLPTKN